MVPKQKMVEFRGEGGKVQHVSLDSLGASFYDIKEHNEKSAKLTSERISGSDREKMVGDIEAQDPCYKNEGQRDVLSETISIFHADDFSRIGISLDSAPWIDPWLDEVRGNYSLEEIAPVQLKFGLQNPDTFISFLDALIVMDKKEFGQTKSSALVGKIGYDIFHQIYWYYSDVLKDERVPAFEQRLGEIVSKYKKLGIKFTDEKEEIRSEAIENYVKYSRQGALGEYIAATKIGVLEKPEEDFYLTFASWIGSDNLEEIQGKWEDAMSLLHQIKANPKAIGLTADVKENLSRCIEKALAEIDSKDKHWDKKNNWQKRKEKKEIFENAKTNLLMI